MNSIAVCFMLLWILNLIVFLYLEAKVNGLRGRIECSENVQDNLNKMVEIDFGEIMKLLERVRELEQEVKTLKTIEKENIKLQRIQNEMFSRIDDEIEEIKVRNKIIVKSIELLAEDVVKVQRKGLNKPRHKPKYRKMKKR